MIVRAKFVVNQVTEFEYPKGAKQIALRPVAANTQKQNTETGKWETVLQCEENRIFGEATPSGEIKMSIHNPTAADEFKIGKAFYVDFTEAPAE